MGSRSITGLVRGIDVQYRPLTRTQVLIVTDADDIDISVTATAPIHQLYLALASLGSCRIRAEINEDDGTITELALIEQDELLTDVQVRFLLAAKIAQLKHGDLLVYPTGSDLNHADRVQVMNEQVKPVHNPKAVAPAGNYADLVNIPDWNNFIKGVDISHYNGNVDWPGLLAGGVEFVYIKVSDGYIDPVTGKLTADERAAGNAAAARDNGLQFGHYHFARPRTSDSDGTVATDARQQADFFINLAKSYAANTLPHALDLEYENTTLSRQEYLDWVNAFIAEIVNNPADFNFTIYSRKEYFERKLPADHGLGNYHLWLSRYSNDYDDAVTIGGWTNWQTWQFSETGVIGANKIDLNIMRK